MFDETILVIDDNIDLIDLLKAHILEPLGYSVVYATDGAKGLAAATEQKPDLIMLDMHMPNLDGLGVLQALRDIGCNIPVIFMTVHGSEQLAIEAFRLGVRDYLVKPFSFRQVRQVVDHALQVSRLAQEKEMLGRNLIAAEAVRQTVTTLAHHINNQLMVINGNLHLLQEVVEQDCSVECQNTCQEMLRSSISSAQRIARVLKTLEKIARVEPTEYYAQEQMLDIDAALAETAVDASNNNN